MEEDNRFRSLERFAREIMETGTLGTGRVMGTRGSAFRQSSTSGTSSGSHTHGIDVGARRNYAHEKAATEKADENKRKREQEVERREHEAEQRRKDSEQRSKQMANEETVTEAKFKYDKPSANMVKAYSNHSVEDLRNMHNRWSADHADKKAKPTTSEKLLAVHHVLKSKGENVGELPKHPSLGMHTYSEETNTEKRRKVVNVARPDDADPRSEKSKLAKQAEIKTKIIEGESGMLTYDKKFGLPASLIAAARSIMEKKDDGLTGGKTDVDLEPETDDSSDQDGDKKAPKKASEKKCDDCGKPMSKCDCDDDDDDKKKKSVKESAEGTTPKTAKEKKLAALSAPKDKITHKDVLVGRGVVKEGLTDEEIEFLDMIAHELELTESSGWKRSSRVDPDADNGGHIIHIHADPDKLKRFGITHSTRDEYHDRHGFHHDNHGSVSVYQSSFNQRTKKPVISVRSSSKNPNAASEFARNFTSNSDSHYARADYRRMKEELELTEDIDEAKRKRVPTAPTATSAPIRGANQDQSGHGVSRNVADYTISDEFVYEKVEFGNPERAGVRYAGVSQKATTTHGNVKIRSDMYPDEKYEFHRHEKSHDGGKTWHPINRQQGDESSALIRDHQNQARKAHVRQSNNEMRRKLKAAFAKEEVELDEARGRPRLPRDEHGKVIRDPAKIAAHRAETDTKKAESPHIVDQLRTVVTTGGKKPVTFKSGETKQIGVNHAKAGLLIHHAAGKPAEKAKMASRMWHSHDSFMSALRGEKAAEPKVKRAAGRGSTSLPPLKSVEKPGSAMSAKTIKRTAQAFAAYRSKKNK